MVAGPGSVPHLLIRADGGPDVGSGHLARCLALAEAWTDARGRVTLCSAQPPERWVERYSDVGAQVLAPGTALPSADWAVLDGYAIPSCDVAAVRAATERLLVVADLGLGPVDAADVLVDQNSGADPATYASRAPVVLLGGRYALLRRQFRVHGTSGAAIPARSGAGRTRLLLSAGESALPASGSVVEQLREAGALDGLEQVPLIGVDDVPSVMASVDLALAAAGSTVWELAFMGVPMVVFAVADNQVPVARHLVEAGLALGEPSRTPNLPALARALALLAADPAQRTALGAAGRRLVDGNGAPRIVTRLRSAMLTLRAVTRDDAPLLWEWVNDPATRASSFLSGPVPWEDHRRWMDARLADPRTFFWLAISTDGRPVGQVRFDVLDAAAEIAVSLAPAFRGQGWGPALVAAGVDAFSAQDHLHGVHRVVARIKPENHASQQVFRFADFDEMAPGDGPSGGKRLQDQPHRCYSRSLSDPG